MEIQEAISGSRKITYKNISFSCSSNRNGVVPLREYSIEDFLSSQRALQHTGRRKKWLAKK